MRTNSAALSWTAILLVAVLPSAVVPTTNASMPTMAAVQPPPLPTSQMLAPAPPVPVVNGFSLVGDWVGNRTLPLPVAYASVSLHNASIAVTGGCIDVACVNRSASTYVYNPDGSDDGYFLAQPLAFPIAGRHSTVSISGRLIAVHMCGMLPESVVIDDDMKDVLNTVEIYDTPNGAVNLTQTTIADAERGGITRANATCLVFGKTIYIYGGVDVSTRTATSSMLALDMTQYPMINIWYSSGSALNMKLPALSLMTGYSDSAAMYLTSGISYATQSRPNSEVYVVVPGQELNPLLNLCVFVSDRGIPMDRAGPSLPPTEVQLLGYAGWYIVKLGHLLASNLNVNGCTAKLCKDMDWNVIADATTQSQPVSPDGGSYPIFATRRGASIVGMPVWQPGTASPATFTMWLFGGIAEVNITQEYTLPPSTAAPTPTPATPSPTNGSDASPSPTQAHLRDLLDRLRMIDDPAAAAEARVGDSGSGSGAGPAVTTPPPPPVPTYMKWHVELQVLDAIKWISTNIAIPGINISTDLTLPVETGSSSDSSKVTIHLVCPPSNPNCAFFNSFCLGGNAEGFGSCQVGFFRDPWCRSSTSAAFLQGANATALSTANLGIGLNMWVCFAYSFLGDCSGSTSFSLINFMDPILTVAANPPTTVAPPAGPASSSQNTLLIAMASLAAALLIGLVTAVAWFRRRQQKSSNAVAGRYEQLGEIGRGAFGRVIKVRRLADDEIFAMKHIDCPSAEVLHEALKEFELLRKLQAHPNIIRVVDMFLNYEVVEGAMAGEPTSRRESNLRSSSRGESVVTAPARHLCIVMDYHPSKDLKQWALGHAVTIPEQVLCHIAVQTCSVLAFIHERNIIHRDLKPENILIVRDDRGALAGLGAGDNTRSSRASQSALQPVVITDFGLAHFVAESRQIGFVGTAVYSAPECVALLLAQQAQQQSIANPGTQHHDPTAPLLASRNAAANLNFTTPRSVALKSRGARGAAGAANASAGGCNVGSQCDIWSLGCVLYAAATRRLERNNVRKMFDDVHRPTFANEISEDLRDKGYSPAFSNFVLRLLKLDPDERPTARDALKYFRKSNRDNSYHVTDTQKLTADERRQKLYQTSTSATAAMGRSVTTPPHSQRPASKDAAGGAATTSPPPAGASGPGTGRVHSGSTLPATSLPSASAPRPTQASPTQSKREATRSSGDADEKESLATREPTPRDGPAPLPLRETAVDRGRPSSHRPSRAGASRGELADAAGGATARNDANAADDVYSDRGE